MTTTKARPFTREDWYGFAGAECWPNSQPAASEDRSWVGLDLDGSRPLPLIREIGEWLLVADRNGMEAYRTAPNESGDEADEVYRLDLPLPTQALALVLLDGLPDTFDPSAYGFVPV